MKAVTISGHGGMEVVEVRDVPAPRPGAGEVVLDVRAAALNHLDIWVRKGGRAALAFPHVLGSTFGSHEDFRLMLRTMAGANLKPVIDSVVPLDRAKDALARMEAGEQFGKIVLKT